jgi:hypothetical protein
VIEPIDFRSRLGRVKDPIDVRDHPLARYIEPRKALALPKNVPSTRKLPIPDQGNTPQCVAYSGGVARAIEEHRDERRWLGFDAPGLYVECKRRDGSPNTDGTYVRIAADILVEQGMTVTASPRTREIGKARKIGSYARCATLVEVQTAIAEQHVVWLGLDWLEEWFEPGPDAVLASKTRTVAGGHAVCLDGYNGRRHVATGVNSWSAGWGRFGRFYLPFDEIERQIAEDTLDAWVTFDVLKDVA